MFDPNIRWKLWNREEACVVLNEMAALADYVLPGIKEGQFLTGCCTPADIADRLLKSGAGAVVIKLGANGAYYSNGRIAEMSQGFR